MTNDKPKILKIDAPSSIEILAQDPEKAKLILEIKKFNRESDLLEPPDQPSNLAVRILKSPWSTIVGIILSSLITWYFTYQDIENVKNQAERDRQKDIYDILLDERQSIYHKNSEDCESFFHVSSAVFEGSEKIGNKNFSEIIDQLIPSIPHKNCQKVAENFATKISIGEVEQKSIQELDQTAEEVIEPGKEVIDKDIEELVSQLNGDQRKQASAALIQLSKTDKKQQVVNALINGIASLDEYRKNLYIAYILGKIDNWDSTDYQEVCNLKTSDYYNSDSTFRKRVNQAINKSKNPCPN